MLQGLSDGLGLFSWARRVTRAVEGLCLGHQRLRSSCKEYESWEVAFMLTFVFAVEETIVSHVICILFVFVLLFQCH